MSFNAVPTQNDHFLSVPIQCMTGNRLPKPRFDRNDERCTSHDLVIQVTDTAQVLETLEDKDQAQTVEDDPRLETIKEEEDEEIQIAAGRRATATSPRRRPCGNCNSGTHALVDCLQVSDDGCVLGCPLCNTGGHDLDSCRRWMGLEVDDKFHLLVVHRGRKPPFATKHNWVSVTKRFATEYPDEALPTEWPLSRQFALQHREALKEEQERWDKDGGGIRLPQVPDPDDFESACESCWPLNA